MKEQEILHVLMKEPSQPFTVSEIIKKFKVKYPSKTVYRHVNRLIKEGILLSKKIGPYNQIKLNLENEGTLAELVKVEIKKKNKFLNNQTSLIKNLFQKLEDELKRIPQIKVTLIFGSFAKGKQRKDSDIDLIILLDKKDKRLKQKIENLLYNLSYEFGDIKINPLIISQRNYLEMLQDEKENVGKQSFKEHIIIKGSYEFWKAIGSIF